MSVITRPPQLLATIAPLLVGTFLAAAPMTADTLVVANKSDATVSLIELEGGTVVATLPTGKGPHEVGISPDGRRALVTNYGNREAPGSTMTLLDLTTPAVLRTLDLGDYERPHGVVWLDEKKVVVTAEAAKALLIVDVDSGRVEKAIDTDQEISHMVAVGPDSQAAFVANIGSGSVTAIDLATGTRRANIATGEGAEGVAVAGDQVWVSNRAADTLTVLSARTLEKLAELPSEGFPIRAVATPDGSAVLVTHARAGDLAVYRTDELGQGRRIALGVEMKDVENRLFGDRFGDSSVPIGVLTDRAGKRVWIAHANADLISEHDLASGERRRLLTAGREPDGMGYSPVTAGKGRPEPTPSPSP